MSGLAVPPPDPWDLLAAWPVPSVAAAVVGPGGVLASYGPVDRAYALASVTKLLVAATMLVAVQEEAVGWEDRPDESLYPHEVTLRQLLSHASGIDRDRRRQVAAPGTRRIYSNAGIEVACAQLELASGISIADYVQQAICQPIGMESTGIPGSPAKDGSSSVSDLARLAGELLAPGRALDAASVAEAASVQFPGLRGVLPGFGHQDPNDWGLGMEIRAHKSPHWTGSGNSARTFGHFGQSGTMLWVDPAAGLALVVLTDRDFGPWAAQAWPALSDAVLARYGA